MKPATKDRMKLLLIVGVSLLFILGLVYLNFSKPIGVDYLSQLKVVDANDKEQMNSIEKYKTEYACKVKEGDEFLLKYNYYVDGEVNAKTFTLTSEQYDKLVKGEYYWFKVKFSDKSYTNGIVKEVYTNNPLAK